MSKTYFIPALLLVGLFACNDGGSKTEEAAAAAPAADSMHKMVDTTQLMTELPPVPDGARVYFVNLKDGQTVKSPFKVEMGAEGISVDSAGTIKAGSGHHHLLIDVGDSLPAGVVIPKDQMHLHFGNAQKETEVTLPPGKHQLTLQFADGIHRSYGSKLASSIMVTVE